MGQRYTGRHREPGRHRPPLTPAFSARHAVPVKLPAKVVRRPVLTGGAVLALVGASAVAYAKAGDQSAPPSSALTLSAAALTSPALSSVADAAATRAEQQEQTTHTQQVAASAAVRDAAKAAALRSAAAAALAAERAAAVERANREAQRQAVIADAVNDPRGAARDMLADYGWSTSQFSCLNSLWTKESGWRFTAENAGSGAYGIPQSLPASKMATVAADYRTNPVTQITWGLRYIKSSYGTPCSAWGHSQSYNWY